MSTRVNLLLAEELRPTTSVSRESMLRLAAVGAGLLVVGWIGLGIWEYLSVSRRHAEASRQWAQIQGDYESVTALQNELNDYRSYLDELGGWGKSRVLWDAPLDELRRIVPENMQLTRLKIMGTIQVPKGKNAKPIPFRRFAINVDGLAEGQLAHQDVIQFVDNLRAGPSLSSWLETVKLQGLQRHGNSPRENQEDAVDRRTFRVDAMSKERPFQ